MSGAEPCTGSYRPGPSPRLAEGSSPIEPAITAASSERMSPKRFSVRITSNRFGPVTSAIAHASTYMWETADVRIALRDLVHDPAPELRRLEHVRLVDRRELLPSLARRVERHPRDPLDLHDRIAHRVERRAPVFREPARLAEVQPAGQLAHDEQVGAGSELRLERPRFRGAGPDLRRPQVRVHAEALPDREQSAFRALSSRGGDRRWDRRPRRAEPHPRPGTPRASRAAAQADPASAPRRPSASSRCGCRARTSRTPRRAHARAALTTSGPMPSPGRRMMEDMRSESGTVDGGVG